MGVADSKIRHVGVHAQGCFHLFECVDVDGMNGRQLHSAGLAFAQVFAHNHCCPGDTGLQHAHIVGTEPGDFSCIHCGRHNVEGKIIGLVRCLFKGIDRTFIRRNLIVGQSTNGFAFFIVVKTETKESSLGECSLDAQGDVLVLAFRVGIPRVLPVVYVQVRVGKNRAITSHQGFSPLFLRTRVDNVSFIRIVV